MFRQPTKCVSSRHWSVLPLVLALLVGTAHAAPESGKRAKPVTGGIETAINLHVPPDAIVWIDGEQTQGRGAERRFVTPPLAPGRYFYDVKVTWMEGGRAVVRQQHLSFRAGDPVNLDFAPGSRLQTQRSLFVDPAAPAPWRTDYNNNPLNWPNFPDYRRFYGYYPPYTMMPMFNNNGMPYGQLRR